MQIIKGIDEFAAINTNATAITVGSFDGLHAGHASLLSKVKQVAAQKRLRSVVVSFTPHPRVALGRAEGLSLLTSDEEKALLLSEYGIDYLILIEFDKQFSALPYSTFISDYLIRRANMSELIIGFNHHMGHDAGSFDQISACAKKYNFNITLATEYDVDTEKVSSTAIRQAVDRGDIDGANRLLAHPYLMIGQADTNGKVKFEEKLKLLPPPGRYLARCNSQIEEITIDAQQQVWCNQKETRVILEIVKRDEK